MDISKSEADIFISYINKVIEEATIHGGDSGGAYCVNKEKLSKAMQSLTHWLSWTRYKVCEDMNGYLFYAREMESE